MSAPSGRSPTQDRAIDITNLGGRLMGKRSSFPRLEGDFYLTPARGVLPRYAAPPPPGTARD
jgi:hypothetical protein